eukprot:1161258-Pelagomonas_calceolata.AAC.1
MGDGTHGRTGRQEQPTARSHRWEVWGAYLLCQSSAAGSRACHNGQPWSEAPVGRTNRAAMVRGASDLSVCREVAVWGGTREEVTMLAIKCHKEKTWVAPRQAAMVRGTDDTE